MSTDAPGRAAPAAVLTAPVEAGVGASAARPDGTLKVTGEFAFSSDLWMAGMLWGATVRSPHPRACIRAVGVAAALRLPGVAAVLTHDDVPGRKTFGLMGMRERAHLCSGTFEISGAPGEDAVAWVRARMMPPLLEAIVVARYRQASLTRASTSPARPRPPSG